MATTTTWEDKLAEMRATLEHMVEQLNKSGDYIGATEVQLALQKVAALDDKIGGFREKYGELPFVGDMEWKGP